MEIVQDLSSQYILYIPVALVIVGAILLFTFGFKSAEQPPFDKLTNEERKSSAGKKRKIKEKKVTANGHVSTSESKNEKTPPKESKKSPVRVVKEVKPEKRENKVEKLEKPKPDTVKTNVDIVKNNKKNLKKPTTVPTDVDDGGWEKVPLKSDKKKKSDQSPDKIKKPKKNENAEKAEQQKLLKEVENREIQEKDNHLQDIEEKPAPKIPESVVQDIEIQPVVEPEVHIIESEEPVVIVEVKKEKEKKKKEKKPKKEGAEKPTLEESVETKADQPDAAVLKVDAVPKEDAVSKVTAPAFDELGDTWSEAKPSKKTGKKKARRDN